MAKAARLAVMALVCGTVLTLGSVGYANQVAYPTDAGNVAQGTNSVAMGNTNLAYGTKSVALGNGNKANVKVDKDGNCLDKDDNITTNPAEYVPAKGVLSGEPAENATAVGVNNAASGVDSVAVGKSNVASSDYAAAIGVENKASSQFSAAIGLHNRASAIGASAMGYGNTAHGFQSAAVGFYNTAQGENSVALGSGNNANVKVDKDGNHLDKNGNITINPDEYVSTINKESGKATKNGTAVGVDNIVLLDNATAVGYSNIASGVNSIAVGYDNAAGSDHATAVGAENTASASISSAIGANNTASNTGASAMGYNNTAGGESSSALGFYNVAGGENSVALGNSNVVDVKYDSTKGGILDKDGNPTSDLTKAVADGNNGIAIGTRNVTNDGVAIGMTNTATGGFSTAIGMDNTSTEMNSAIGWANTTSHWFSSAVGILNAASGVQSSALGFANKASGQSSTAVGNSNIVAGADSATLGENNKVGVILDANGDLLKDTDGNLISGGSSSIALGNNNTIANTARVNRVATLEDNVSILGNNNATTNAKDSQIVGDNNTIENGQSNFIGGNNHKITTATGATSMTKNNVILGSSDEVTEHTVSGAVVIGHNAAVTKESGVALGENSVAATAAGQSGYDPLTGLASTDTSSTWKASAAAVSVGDGDNQITRQITNVAAGSELTDAVNVAQLKAVQDRVDANKTHFYSVNSTDTGAGNYHNEGAIGKNALAAGVGDYARGEGSTAVGYSNNADGNSSTVVGYRSGAGGSSSTAVGDSNNAYGEYSTAIGGQNSANAVRDSSGQMINNGKNYGTAVGYRNQANGEGALATGYENYATEDFSTAVGSENTALGYQSSAIGLGNTAASDNASALGYSNAALGFESVAVGGINEASGKNASAVGYRNTASEDGAVAMGNENTAEGVVSTAVGNYNTASGDFSDAVGYNNTASGFSSSALGFFNEASGKNASAVGNTNAATEDGAVAMGNNNTAEGVVSTAVGNYNTASGDFSDAVGYNNTASGFSSSALGFFNEASGKNASALGYENTARGNRSTAVGTENYAGGNDTSSAVGWGNRALDTGSSALGGGNTAGGYASSAVGSYNTAAGTNSVAVGKGNKANVKVDKDGNIMTDESNNEIVSGDNSAAVGIDNIANGQYSTAVGVSNQATITHASALGYNNTAWGEDSTAVGSTNKVYTNNSSGVGSANLVEGTESGAFGYNNHITTAGTNGYVLGSNSTVSAANSVAIGNEATASTANSVALGFGAVTGKAHTGTKAKEITFGDKTYTYAGLASQANGTVSVGTKGAERQIQNVAAGKIAEKSTDAVNGSQLWATNQGLSQLDQNAVKYDTNEDGTVNYNQVTLQGDSNTGTKITNVADGDVSDTSMDAVNGSQLQGVYDKIGTVTTNYNGVSDNNTVGQNIDALNVSIGTVGAGHHYIAPSSGEGSASVGENLVKLDDAIFANTSALTKGYTFAGNTGEGSVAVGKKVSIKGSDKDAAKSYSGKNITTIYTTDNDGNGTINIEMSDNPEFATVTTTGGITAGGVIKGNGLDASDAKVINVGAGTIGENSTDAVNGGQLFAVKATAEAGWNLTTNDQHKYNVQPGQTVDFANEDGNVAISNTNNNVKINLNKDITLGDATNYVKLTGTDGTITTSGNVYVGGKDDGILLNASDKTINNLSNLSWDTTKDYSASGQAATEAQLYAVSRVANSASQTDYRLVGAKDANGTYTDSYQVGADHSVQLNVQDQQNPTQVDTVTINDVAKASEVGDVSSIANDLKNGTGTTTVVDAVNNLNNKVGDLDYSNENYTGDIKDGDSTTEAIGKLNNTVGDLGDRVTDVEKTAGKHSTVAAADSNVKITTSEDETTKGTKYTVGLNKETIDLGNVTIKGNDGDITAKTMTAGKTSISDSGVVYDGKTYIDSNGINANNQKITNVAAGDVSKDSTDAVNGSQLYGVQQDVTNMNTNVTNLGNEVRDLDNRVDRVGAGAAALAALHPLDFDPDAKWDFAAGYGNYRGANAVAVGAYYRPNEDTMLSVGGSFGGGENMVNAGVSFKLGGGSHVSTSKVAMAKEIKDLRQEMEAMKSAILDQNAGKKLDTSKLQLFPDVPENHWAYQDVAVLAGNGVIKGYPDGTFDGGRTMTRYEFASMLYRAMLNGATLSDKMLNEFAPELERFTVDTVHKDKNGTPTVERVRTIPTQKKN
jgi:autotransporter adhesin